jgi:hypothetical protein
MSKPTKRKPKMTLHTILAECEKLESRVRELSAEIADFGGRAAPYLKANNTQPPATKKANKNARTKRRA